MRCSAKSLALLAIALSPCAFSQSGLLGQKSADGQIHFQAVEELQIDGSHRVRLMPIATQRITPDDAKRFPHEDLAQAGTIRADAGHRLVRIDDAGTPTDLILPDSFAPKQPVDAAAAQGSLNIVAVLSKKSKLTQPVPQDQFFVFVPGPDADGLALALVNRPSVFLNLDEQLAAMEGLAASFPDSPAKAELRSQLQERIASGLAAFDNRGPYADLLLTRRYAELAGRAFAGDPELGKLSGEVAAIIRTVESARLNLKSLAASGQWDTLIADYLSFEHYQWSFPDMMALRQTALEESARQHAHRGRLLSERHEYSAALSELARAAAVDPDNRETAKLLETTRLVTSLAAANAGAPYALSPGSPEDQRFKRSLHDAERAIQDKDYSKADAAIQEAQKENKDAPELLILRAKLLAARDRDSEALVLLDSYDRSVTDSAARESGYTARNDILYDLEKKRSALKQQLQKLQREGEYSKLRTAANQALALDQNDDDFLYFGGVTAALFDDPDGAQHRLDRYLTASNSLRGDLEARDRAFRIRRLLHLPKLAPPAGTANWLSGWPLPEGAYYCPLSAAFQPQIESIAAYKLKMNFQWNGSRLRSINTTFDDEKGSLNYHSLGGPGESQGNFFFGYTGTDPQVQVASTHPFDASPALAEVRVAHSANTPAHLVDDHGQPRLLLQESPYFNTAVLSVLEGPIATGIAGNSFFNPFIWDGLHYFTLSYDSLGQLASAREWTADNVVRFTWSAGRLTEIRAFRKDSSTPYYQRTISYSGAMISGESYTQGAKTGQIKYVYSGKVLQQVKVEDGGVHDGKTWTVRLR